MSTLQNASAAFRELYCRTSNPARPYMLWLPEVREARRLFRAFRARMAELVQEVRSLPSPGVNSPGSPSKMMPSLQHLAHHSLSQELEAVPLDVGPGEGQRAARCGGCEHCGPPAAPAGPGHRAAPARRPLAGEFGLFFSAGIESAGNAISWTLWGPCLLLP